MNSFLGGLVLVLLQKVHQPVLKNFKWWLVSLAGEHNSSTMKVSVRSERRSIFSSQTVSYNPTTINRMDANLVVVKASVAFLANFATR